MNKSSEYPHRLKNTKDRGKQLFWIISLVFILALFFQNEIAAQEKLRAGTWKGTILTHDGKLYKMKYIVSYGDESQKAPVRIKMVNLDLEPTPEFTYQLLDIEIKNKQLKFRIPKEYETKECTLEKEDGEYSGACISNAGTTEETSEITMVPPAEASPGTE